MANKGYEIGKVKGELFKVYKAYCFVVGKQVLGDIWMVWGSFYYFMVNEVWDLVAEAYAVVGAMALGFVEGTIYIFVEISRQGICSKRGRSGCVTFLD